MSISKTTYQTFIIKTITILIIAHCLHHYVSCVNKDVGIVIENNNCVVNRAIQINRSPVSSERSTFLEVLMSDQACVPPGIYCQGAYDVIQLNQAVCTYENMMVQVGSQVFDCVVCYFPNHCDTNSQCLPGTGGSTCERCLSASENNDIGYETIGSSCVRCGVIPWGALALPLFLVPIIVNFFYDGVSESVSTKARLLSHYVHSLWISAFIRINWSQPFKYFMQVLTFIHINTSTFSLECFLGYTINTYYWEWTSTIALCFVMLVVVWVTDENLQPRRQPFNHKRCLLRRIFSVIFTWNYVSLIKVSLQPIACAGSIPANVTFYAAGDTFLYDQSTDISCDNIIFQILTLFSIIFLLIATLVAPFLITMLVLRLRRLNRLQRNTRQYGSLYESYTRLCCIWEPLILIRKCICLFLLLVYPFSVLIQFVVVLTSTFLYIVMLVAFRPYRCCSYRRFPRFNIHLAFELVSNLVVLLLQVLGLVDLLYPDSIPEVVDILMVVLLSLPLIMWHVMMLCVALESDFPQLEEEAPTPEPQLSPEASTNTFSLLNANITRQVTWRRKLPVNHSSDDIKNAVASQLRSSHSNKTHTMTSLYRKPSRVGIEPEMNQFDVINADGEVIRADEILMRKAALNF